MKVQLWDELFQLALFVKKVLLIFPQIFFSPLLHSLHIEVGRDYLNYKSPRPHLNLGQPQSLLLKLAKKVGDCKHFARICKIPYTQKKEKLMIDFSHCVDRDGNFSLSKWIEQQEMVSCSRVSSLKTTRTSSSGNLWVCLVNEEMH